MFFHGLFYYLKTQIIMDELIQNQKIEETIKRILKKEKTQLSIGVILNGKIKIFKYNDDNPKYYDIGSISKVFTSLMILKAQDEGLLNIYDEIDKYIELKSGKYPKIKDLLSHRTGYFFTTPLRITIPGIFKRYSRKNIYQNIKKEDVISSIERLGYRSEKYGYSDFSYALLSLIIENVYNNSFTEVFNSFIEELELTETKTIDNNILRKDCYLFNKKINNWVWNNNPYIASGGIASSINDMSNFLLKLMSKKEDYIKESFLILDEHKKHNYSFFISKNHHVYTHIGGVGTFRSSISINPKRKIGIVVLSNSIGRRRGNVGYLNKMIYYFIRRNKIRINFD